MVHRYDLRFRLPVVKMHSILRNHHSLTGFKLSVLCHVDVFALRFQIFYSRIIQIQLSIYFQRTSREHTVPIIIFCREQRNALMFPMDQIFTHRMPPVHGSPHRSIREMLIEQMVFSFVIYKSVRIVDPVSRSF